MSIYGKARRSVLEPQIRIQNFRACFTLDLTTMRIQLVLEQNACSLYDLRWVQDGKMRENEP